MILLFVFMTAVVGGAAYLYGRFRGKAMTASGAKLHSRPGYHGLLVASLCVLPMLAVLFAWTSIAPRYLESRAIAALPAELQPKTNLEHDARFREARLVALGQFAGEVSPGLARAGAAYAAAQKFNALGLFLFGFVAAAAGFLWGRRQLSASFRARNEFESITQILLIACSAIAVMTTIGIVLSVLFETLRFVQLYPWYDFLFGLQWSPQTAIRTDQVGQSGSFGAVPLFVGTALITLIAMLVAGPVGLFAAIYMSEYASRRFRSFAKPLLEVLAGIPTVVFGFFAALSVAPTIKWIGEAAGLPVASESALAAGLVMGIMIIPFVSSLSDDVITAVPQALRDGSYAMGATHSETIKRVILPAALPGIVSAMMLAISRAVGETMIVVMAAGLAGNLTFNPLEAVTTVTVQIKTLLVGDQEFDSAKTLSAFALGFVLFFFTLTLNVVALRVVRRYREQYD
jgi:phosphate transport system permease protein